MLLWVAIFSLASSVRSIAQKQPDSALFRVVRSGEVGGLKQRLDAGADPNASDKGFSVLMAATLCGSVGQMRLLLERGANPNAADEDSITALWLAVPDTAKTSLLLDRGANPALLSKEHYNLLVKLVSFAGTTPLFRRLVARGADPRGGRDNLVLYNAAGTDDTILVSYLLGLGLRPNDTTFFGDYPINSAVNYRCFATLKLLVEHGANVNVGLPNTVLPNQRGITPLMLAAVGDDEQTFYYLLDHGADIHAKSRTGYTALHFVQMGLTDHPGMTRALLARGADPLEKAIDGNSPRSLSANKGNSLSAQLLNKKN
jgi:ankyrin repeat protein